MKFHFWHTMLSLFFAAVAVGAYYWLCAHGRLPEAGGVSLADFLLMTLAIFRLVRLFTYDAITTFIREWFAGAHPESFRGSLAHLSTARGARGSGSRSWWFLPTTPPPSHGTPSWCSRLLPRLPSSSSWPTSSAGTPRPRSSKCSRVNKQPPREGA